MPYETVIDAVQILRSTLHLLEHTDFPEKNWPTIADLVKHLHATIADLEVTRHKLEVVSAIPPARSPQIKNSR